VIALLVLELGVVGAVGIVVLASATLGRAERLERAVALAEGVLDSLASVPDPGGGSTSDAGGAEVRWSVGSEGALTVVALGPLGDTILSLASVLPGDGAAP
jgi:hypothetical protein